MNRLLLLLLLALPAAGCKKLLEDRATQQATDIVTRGRWVLTAFSTGSENQLPLFNGYSFQFHENQTVDAYRESTLVQSGAWVYDLAARTVTPRFDGAIEPLSLLNGTWQVIRSTDTTVVAEQPSGSVIRRLALLKSS